MAIISKTYFLIFIISFICSYLFTFLVCRISIVKRFVDRPAGRKVHKREIPTLGGIAIWVSFNLGMFTALTIVPSFKTDFMWPFLGISISAFMILITGIYDDLHELNAYFKLLIQVFAAIILISFGFEINVITKPLGGGLPLGFLGFFITVLWIVGMINAINLLDGLDGLSAGVSAIALLFLFIAALQMQIQSVMLLSLCLCGALVGFLPHNFHPAKIFMGNTGSMFIGLVLSVIAIAGFQKRTTIFTMFVPLMAVAVPLIDTFLSILRRLLKKKPVFKADKDHIHHRLLSEEKSQPKAVLSLYFLTFSFGLIALSFSKLKGIYAILALIIVVLVTIKWLKDWGFLNFK